MLVLKGLVGLHKTIQLQLLQCYWLGIDLDNCDIEWFALEANRGHSVIFEFASKYSKYFGHLMQRVDSLEKTLLLGGIGGRRRRGR